MNRERAYSVLTIKKIVQSDDERLIEGIASTPNPDRVNDIVEPLGAKFSLPIPLLLATQCRGTRRPGRIRASDQGRDSFPRAHSQTRPSPAPLRQWLIRPGTRVKAGVVRGVSIGFKTTEKDVLKNGGWRIKAWEWFELSLVTIPANVEATITNIKSFDRQTSAAPGQRRLPSSNAGAAASSTKGSKMKDFSEQITAQEEKRTDAAERLKALMAKDDDGEGLDEKETARNRNVARRHNQRQQKTKKLAAFGIFAFNGEAGRSNAGAAAQRAKPFRPRLRPMTSRAKASPAISGACRSPVGTHTAASKSPNNNMSGTTSCTPRSRRLSLAVSRSTPHGAATW